MKKRSVTMIALLAVAVLLFSGCSVRGGGRLLDSDFVSRQSTFGINAVATMPDNARCMPYVKGHFTYFDKPETHCDTPLKVLGEIDGMIALDVDPCFGAYAMLHGTYEDLEGTTGPACIFLYDSQLPGWIRNEYPNEQIPFDDFFPDRIGIKLMNRPGCPGIYFNCAPFDQGNIKICAPEFDLCR